MNKALNIAAWVFFVLSIISYLVSDFTGECTYFAAAAIFLVIAPRSLR